MLHRITEKIAWSYRVLQQNSGVSIITNAVAFVLALISFYIFGQPAFGVATTALVIVLLLLDLIDTGFSRITWAQRNDLAYFVIGVIALYYSGLSAWYAITGIGLMIAAGSALFTFTIGSRLDLAGYNIPGVGRTYNPNFEPLLSICLPAAAVCTAWSGTATPLGVFATVVVYGTLLLVFANGMIGVVRFLHRPRVEKEIAGALERQNATFAFFFGTDASQLYQVEMWLPLLNRLNKPYFIIVRDKEAFLQLQSLTKVPIVFCRRFIDVEKVFVPSLKTILYVNTALSNMQMVRFPQFTHIMLNHGDSDKVASFSPTMRMFDKNFVAGQAAIDRFTNHDVQVFPEQFEIVGRPQLNGVHVMQGAFSEVKAPTVLYAPTWSGWVSDSQYSSLFQGEQIIRILLDRGYRVIFRSHPMTEKNPELMAIKRRIIEILEAANAQGGHHVFGDVAENNLDIFECFNQSDMLITDVSSVPADYLYSQKPSIMMNVSSEPEDFEQEFPLSRASYVVTVKDGSVEPLKEVLESIAGDDPMGPLREELKKYYLAEAPQGREYDELFVETLKKYL